MAANKIQVGYIEPQDGVQFKVDEGTAAAPGICFVDSAATGLYSPGTGQIAWSTSGKQTALRILADGKVGIDCSPTVALEVNGTIKASAIDAPIEGTLDDWIVHAGDTNTKIGFSANDTFQVQTGGSARLTVTDSATTVANNAVFNGNSNVLAGNYFDIQNNKKLRLGTNGDCAFYFNGSATLIETGNKIIHIQTDASIRLQKNDPQAHMLIANAGGSVDLYHNGTLKLATDADGIRIGSGGGDNTIVDLHNASYDNGVIQYYNGSINLKTGSSNGDRQISLQTAGLERLLIKSNGQIGVNMAPSADAQFCIKNSDDSNYNVFDCYNDNGNKMGGFSQDSTGNGTVGVRTNGGDLNVLLRSSGNSYVKGGRFLVGTDTHSISSSEMFEVKSTGAGFSHFRNNHSDYATIYIDNEYSDTGYAPYMTFTDGGGNRGGIGQDNNDLLRIHGQGGVEFFTNGTHGGGTQTAKFSSSSGESYLTIVGDKAPAGTGGNLILQNLNTTTEAASTIQFADTGGQTISAINGVCVDQSTNEGLLTFHTRAANGVPVERLRLAASNHIHMFNSAANGADRLNILGGGDGISIARNNGTNASDGNILGNLSFHSYTSGSYHANAEAKIEAVAATIANQPNSGSNAPTDLLFYTKANGYGPGSAPQESMRIYAQGVVRAKYGTDEQNNNGSSFYSPNTGFLGSQFTNWGPLFPFFYLGETSNGSGSTSFHALDSYASHHWGGFPRMMIFAHYRYYGGGFSAWTYGNYGGSSHVGDLYLVSGWGGYGASHAGSLPSSQTGSGINCTVTQTRTNNVAVHAGANVHRWKLDFATSGAHVYIRWYVGFMGVGRGLYTSEKSQADVTSSCSSGGCVHLRTMNRNHFRNCSYLD